MEMNEIIGNNLKDYRHNIGYNQEDIAKYLGVDRSTISHYENSTREISLVHLNKLADLFGIELSDLLAANRIEKYANLAFAFRSQKLEEEDYKSIAEFQKIVKNYIQIVKLAQGE
jgi:transcriptional regulator with XRE-family HTH domain